MTRISGAEDRQKVYPWPRVEFGGLKVRNPSKWWRPDGTRPVVGEPTDGLLLHDPTKYDESGELTAIRLLREAIATGDDQAIERAADEAEAADRDEKRRFARLAADRKRREAKRAAERRRIWELEAKGWDRFEAEAEVTGHSAENLRRWAFMEQARAEGHQGKTFEALVRSVHRTLSLAAEAASEETTRGHSLKREFEGRIDSQALWVMSDREVRKYASEELLSWFDQHGRITRDAVRRHALSTGSTEFVRPDQHREDYHQ